MSDKKQIEELARIIDNIEGNAYPIDWGDDAEADSDRIAEALYNAGYRKQVWILANEPPKEYRDEYGELIPFLVCEDGTEYPFRAMYDGKSWGDGLFAIPVTHWMPLPEAPKGE